MGRRVDSNAHPRFWRSRTSCARLADQIQQGENCTGRGDQYKRLYGNLVARVDTAGEGAKTPDEGQGAGCNKDKETPVPGKGYEPPCEQEDYPDGISHKIPYRSTDHKYSALRQRKRNLLILKVLVPHFRW